MDENNEKEKKTDNEEDTEKFQENITQEKKKEAEKQEAKSKDKKKSRLPIILGSILIIFILIFSVFFSLISINNENILDNVSIMGIDVSDMSKEKAEEAVSEVITSKLQEELILKKDDYETLAEEYNRNYAANNGNLHLRKDVKEVLAVFKGKGIRQGSR